MSASDPLLAAVAAIGARRVSARRWAYYAEETRAWYSCSRADLVALGALLDDPDHDIRRDAYSHWCASWGRLASRATLRDLGVEGAQ